ncbi:PepSY domain-containing protein [Hydrogenophaga sp. PAMC20947]|uniref:PepSY domain-containing protein n=1 Tax=Hydrogenophaga sp. PAMC20947 TaxID=2565558 RepID=UPI00109D9382|nr:PepSY domain-containing protein [Hydrogenophaga sp. PAMC20947]QCB47824.1 PepSY domain-containing protein [Hydrogenophaga sp. PAMC20947]
MNFRRPFNTRILLLGPIAAALSVLFPGHALASEPKERVICTTEPRSSWMSEAEARERFHAENYLLLSFKLSSENCHEFYAVEHDGTVVEAYVHPITGQVVRLTRIPPPKPNRPARSAPASTSQ